MAALFAPDAVVVPAGGRPRRGRAEIAAYYAKILAPFPEHHDEPVRVVVSGDDVTVEIAYRGVLANGRELAFDALNVYRLAGGLIARLTQWYDTDRVRRMLLEGQAAGDGGGDGSEPALGSVARATPERLRAALGLVRRGAAFRLDLPLGEPDPPLFGREPVRHAVGPQRRAGAELGRPPRRPQHPGRHPLGRPAPPAAPRRPGLRRAGAGAARHRPLGGRHRRPRGAGQRGGGARPGLGRGPGGLRRRGRGVRRAPGGGAARGRRAAAAHRLARRLPRAARRRAARADRRTGARGRRRHRAPGWSGAGSPRSPRTTPGSRRCPARPRARCSTTA